jgi:hypothetical protein
MLVFKWYWVIASLAVGGSIMGIIFLKPAMGTYWTKWLLWLSGLIICLFAVSIHYGLIHDGIFSDYHTLAYLTGMTFLIAGSVRRSTDLYETVGKDSAVDDKLMQFAILMTLSLSILGGVQFEWWIPLIAFLFSFVFVLLINMILSDRITSTLNKFLIYAGLITSGISSITN